MGIKVNKIKKGHYVVIINNFLKYQIKKDLSKFSVAGNNSWNVLNLITHQLTNDFISLAEAKEWALEDEIQTKKGKAS